MKVENMEKRLREIPGTVSFWCEDTADGTFVAYQAKTPVVAASVIKLCVMAEAFRRREAGTLDFSEPVTIRPEDRLPSCGALTYLHEGITVTLGDLVTLMIILSDNTATNLLIDRLGIEPVNRFMREIGLSEQTQLRRKLFMPELSARGIENTVTAADMALLLKRILNRQLVSEKASDEMLRLLSQQRLNGKMPFFLSPKGIKTAHKTGEDQGITHDVGIILTDAPKIFCFLSEKTDVPAAERALQDLALMAVED